MNFMAASSEVGKKSPSSSTGLQMQKQKQKKFSRWRGGTTKIYSEARKVVPDTEGPAENR